MQKIILAVIFLSTIKPLHRGELLTFEFMESKTSGEIYLELSELIGQTVPLAQYGSSIYSIRYRTIDPFGNYTIASGSVSIPDTDIYCPILSYQHGTTLKRDKVSSVRGFDLIGTWLSSAGFITTQPDYLGLGASELFHPYQIANPYGTDIVDILRATKELINELNIHWNGQLFLTGYSEGGYATMAVQKALEEDYPYEFNLTLSIPMAGAHSMSGVMFDLMMEGEPYGEPWYLPYTVFAYDYVYELYNSPEEYLKPEYADILPPLFDGYHSTSEVNSVMPSIPINIFKDEYVADIQSDENHPLRACLRENDLFDWKPQTTTILYHSNNDELVPVSNSVIAYNSFINNGAIDCGDQPGPVPMNCVELNTDNWGPHSSAALYTIVSGMYDSASRVNNRPPAKYSIVNHNIEYSFFDINIESQDEIGGFQFNIFGAEIESIESLLPNEISFEISSSTDLIIGFSFTGDTIPAGEQQLCRVYYTNNDTKMCIYNSTTADELGDEIPSINKNCVKTDLSGDINFDGEINILDIVIGVNIILENESYSNEQFETADQNNDGLLNILDIILLINIILS